MDGLPGCEAPRAAPSLALQGALVGHGRRGILLGSLSQASAAGCPCQMGRLHHQPPGARLIGCQVHRHHRVPRALNMLSPKMRPSVLPPQQQYPPQEDGSYASGLCGLPLAGNITVPPTHRPNITGWLPVAGTVSL